MDEAAGMISMIEQDRQIEDVIARERPRLRSFIRRRVANEADADDLLQDVFSELVQAYRVLMPIEFVGGWLFRVARNRITDLFRKKRPELFSDSVRADEEGAPVDLEELLPSPDEGPEAAYLRGVLLEELRKAIAELPADQRKVFLATEFEGRSFKELSAESGVNVNTLLSRKRYAVLHLRKRLERIHEEFLEK
jgi:RNA polymerase sigma factor (sigma-70 family)